ncbi:hypothetical protein PG985_004220 [Apiospora marii]|uniref:uncharacterized protein n=1 Tax=Apiospora marii TaxID=335849 RepID=UPI003130AF7C
MSVEEPQSVKIPDNNQAVWLAYANEVKGYLLGATQVGPKQRLYIAPPSRVFGGGADSALPVFNKRIHDYSNYLMENDGSPFYVKTDIDYIQHLARCGHANLNHAFEMDGDNATSATAKDELAKLRSELETRKQSYANQEKKEQQMYKKYVLDCRERAEDPEPYEDRVLEKLGNLHEGWWNTAVKVENKTREIYGSVYANILRKLNQAQDSNTSTPGITMQATDREYKASDTVDTANVYQRPAWTLGGFETHAQQVASLTAADAQNNVVWDISASKGQSRKWEAFGQSSSAAESGPNNFLVASHDASSSRESKVDQGLNAVVDDMTLRLAFKRVETYDISAGGWSSNLDMFKLEEGVQYKEYVKPQALLIGYGPSMDVTFSDDAKASFEKSLQQANESSSTGLKILGMPITGSSSRSSSSSDKSTGEAHYNKESGLHIRPAEKVTIE